MCDGNVNLKKICQDSLDLFVGNHKVSPTEGVSEESPLAPLKTEQRYMALPIALALCLSMITLSIVVPTEFSTEILLSILFWAGVLGVYTGALIYSMGDKHRENMPYTLHVLLGIAVFFTLLVASIADPFHAMDPVPSDGPGPNPQGHG